MLPDQVFIYLLIGFGVLFFFHQHSEWQDAGSLPASILPKLSRLLLVFYSIGLWAAALALAVLYWDALEGSYLHLAAYLVAAILANTGLLLRQVVKCSILKSFSS